MAVLLLRKRPPPEAAGLIRAAKDEIAAGAALLPASAASELIIGERTPAGVEDLSARLGRLPTAILSNEAAALAGSTGAFLAESGALIPVPDLLIAGTALWLDVPLLAWDTDYDRSRHVALASGSSHPGAELWRSLRLHPETLRA